MKWLADTLARWFWAALEWLQQAGVDVANGILGTLTHYLPDLAPLLSAHAVWIERINVFFPLTETVALASAYFGLWCLVNAARLGRWLIAARAVRAVVGGGS